MICHQTKISKFGNCSASVFPTGRTFFSNTGLGTVHRRSIRWLSGKGGKLSDISLSLFGQSQRHGISGTTLPAFRESVSYRTNGVPVWLASFSRKPFKKPPGAGFFLQSCTARSFWCRITFLRDGNSRTIRLSCGTAGICRFRCGATAPCTTNWAWFPFRKVHLTFIALHGNNFQAEYLLCSSSAYQKIAYLL